MLAKEHFPHCFYFGSPPFWFCFPTWIVGRVMNFVDCIWNSHLWLMDGNESNVWKKEQFSWIKKQLYKTKSFSFFLWFCTNHNSLIFYKLKCHYVILGLHKVSAVSEPVQQTFYNYLTLRRSAEKINNFNVGISDVFNST